MRRNPMSYLEKYNAWRNSPDIDEADRAELVSIEGNDSEIKERFISELEFGTAGLRGILGVGTNRMNRYIVRKATKGFAEYIFRCI